ncbi:MAG: hypothetical protein CL447_06100 [Acidimicrobiaceae bacterium]|nr:hypothetical protein [Acidimicrobiaceae bacterium]HBU75919.1 hypothetical protein [Acidimicrobiaceae bacterium]
MHNWRHRQWLTAVVGAVVVAFAVGLPTDVIPNPLFGRPVDVTWWSYPSLAVTSLLGGLLLATYVAKPQPVTHEGRGIAGGLLGFFAIGCPVCNKLVVIALGTSGALDWFAPTQPILAVLSMVLLALALRQRLNSADSCEVPNSGTMPANEHEAATIET